MTFLHRMRRTMVVLSLLVLGFSLTLSQCGFFCKTLSSCRMKLNGMAIPAVVQIRGPWGPASGCR